MNTQPAYLCGHHLVLPAAAKRILARHLTPRASRLKYRPHGGFRVTHTPPESYAIGRKRSLGLFQAEAEQLEDFLQRRRMYRDASHLPRLEPLAETPGTIVPAGWLRRVRQTLSDHAITLRLLRPRDEFAASSWPHFAHELRYTEYTEARPLLQALAQASRVYYAPDLPAERDGCVVALLRAFQGQRALVLVRDLEQCRQLIDYVRQERQVYIPRRYGEPSAYNVVFDTLPGMGWRGYGGFALIAVFHPDLLTSRGLHEQVREFNSRFRVAFGPSPQRLTVADELLIEGTFGPLIRSPYRTPRFVLRVQCDSAGPTQGDSLAQKRLLIWHNVHRNRLLAEMTAAMSQRGPAVLQELDVDPRMLSRPHEENPPWRCCLLVESTEHARQLKKLLPRWARKRTASLTGPDEPPVAVRTFDEIRNAPLECAVAVLADGCQAAWPGAVQLARLRYGPPLVIDVSAAVDAFIPGASERRRHDYERRGWLHRTITAEQVQHAMDVSARPSPRG